MAHSLPPLPYAPDALEPHIDKATMEIHHGKHHQAYVNNLNAALEKHAELQGKSAEDLIKNLSAVPDDIRINFYVTGGEVWGPKCKGKLKPVGGDWLILRRDGCAVLDVRACLADGTAS